jgi:hypothetical protein
MVPERWSVNRLACELGMDRRSLARKLEGLEPVEERKAETGNRTERFYRLADVFAHLANGSAEKLDLNAERARLTIVQRQKLEMELGEMQGELIRVEAVVKHWQDGLANMRSHFLRIPSQIAMRHPGDFKSRGVAQQLAQEVVYTSLDEYASRGALPADDGKKLGTRTSMSTSEPGLETQGTSSVLEKTHGG